VAFIISPLDSFSFGVYFYKGPDILPLIVSPGLNSLYCYRTNIFKHQVNQNSR